MARRPKAPVVSIDDGAHRERVLQARNRLIEENLEMVESIAKRIQQSLPPSFELSDLVGAGHLGLVRAAAAYRPRRHGGCPFSAYARHKVRGAILDSIRRRHYIENTRPSIYEERDRYTANGEHMHDKMPSIADRVADPRDLETDLDRGALLKRLEAAIARLTNDQQALLDAYYADDVDRLKRAHWRRRKQVAETHAAIISILRQELAS